MEFVCEIFGQFEEVGEVDPFSRRNSRTSPITIL